MVPASIRYKNPGAMWGKGNAIATKWGSTATVYLNDGKGQGNNIAVFPTFVQGICAQLDLWRTSPRYRNKRFADAIAVWSGYNSVESYIRYVLARVPGMTRDTIMDDAFWKSPMGLGFLKAQAGHEAGRVYPAPDADWIEAQRRVFSGVPTKNTVKKAATATTTVVPAATAAAHMGLSLPVALAIGIGIAAIIFLAWKFWPRDEAHDTPHPGAGVLVPEENEPSPKEPPK